MTLPFKTSPSVLGDSYPKAVQRMHSIERKFVRDPKFAALYNSFMREYLELGHMKEANQRSAKDQPSRILFTTSRRHQEYEHHNQIEGCL